MRNEGRGQEDALSRELAGGGAATSRGDWRKERMKNRVKRQGWLLLPQAPLLGGRMPGKSHLLGEWRASSCCGEVPVREN